MDPNATLRAIQEAERADVPELCEALRTWIRKGGFEPDWERFPKGTTRYRASEWRPTEDEAYDYWLTHRVSWPTHGA